MHQHRLPQYIHKLQHLAARLLHFFQFGKLISKSQALIQNLQGELQCFLEDTSDKLRVVEFTQPVSTHMVDMTEGRPNLTSDKPTHSSADHLTVLHVTIVLPNNQDAPPQPNNKAFSNLHGSFGSEFARPFHIYQVAQAHSENVPGSVTDRMHIGMLLKFLRVQVCLRDLVIVCRISPAKILLVF